MFIENFLMVNAKNLPAEKIPYLREKLYSLPETRVKSIQAFPFKDSTISLVLSLFLGPYGVDRFFLGEVGLGILKLVGIAGLIVFVVGMFGFVKVPTDKVCYISGFRRRKVTGRIGFFLRSTEKSEFYRVFFKF